MFYCAFNHSQVQLFQAYPNLPTPTGISQDENKVF